ncbi:hypothetical protein [Nocardioides sp.]|uniref:hypothetical protein n=1 Tax=Nocardioides sp. TaxID=35761 RepID=UPI00321A5D3E
MPAQARDVATLARKLRGKGLDDQQVTEGLRGMGFSRAQSAQAVRDLGPTAAPAKTAAGRGRAKKPGDTQVPPAAPAPPAAPSTTARSFTPPAVPSLTNFTLTPPKKLDAGDVGGFLAGLLVYTLALNYIRSGPEGITAWLRAKFLNEPTDDLDDATKKRGKKPPRSYQLGGDAGPVPAVAGIANRGLTDVRPTTPEPL